MRVGTDDEHARQDMPLLRQDLMADALPQIVEVGDTLPSSRTSLTSLVAFGRLGGVRRDAVIEKEDDLVPVPDVLRPDLLEGTQDQGGVLVGHGQVDLGD